MPERIGRRPRGFTLVEVALTIAMGLIIIASAMMAFNITKRNAITATQQQEAAAIKAILETAVARGTFPAWSTALDVSNGFFSIVETAKKNPYSGTPRTWGSSGISAYYACNVEGQSGVPATLWSPLANPCKPSGSDPGVQAGAANNIMGGFVLIYDTGGSATKFAVKYSDGTQKFFDGWAFVETDMSGNIASAVGGGIGSTGSSG